MLLYWGIFTIGFFAGSILSFMAFAAKKPEDDPEYEAVPIKALQGQSEAISLGSPYLKGKSPSVPYLSNYLPPNPSHRQQRHQIPQIN